MRGPDGATPAPHAREWLADAMAQSYDVAFSFAGEDREVARALAEMSIANGIKVFFDEHHAWQTWGRDLSEFLHHVYARASRYTVILISEAYCNKPYTIWERRAAISKLVLERSDTVLPIVLDDSWPEGLIRTIGYVDLRQRSIEDVAALIAQKVRGPAASLRPASPPPLKVAPIALPPAAAEPATASLEFAAVDTIAGSHWSASDRLLHEGTEGSGLAAWSDRPVRWRFKGGMGFYPDPMFDMTLLNGADRPVLLSAVGLTVLGANFRSYEGLGGGGSGPVSLDRTYILELPDVWRALAQAHRTAGLTRHDRSGRRGWVEMEETVWCRLPNPILLQPHTAYRYGLDLFDYTAHCPTEVELAFSLKTNRGIVRSERVRLNYFIGSDIPAVQRYRALLDGQTLYKQTTERLAYQLWERDGRPEDAADRTWREAQRILKERPRTVDGLLHYEDDWELNAVHVRGARKPNAPHPTDRP